MTRNTDDDIANMEQTTSNMQPSSEITGRLNSFEQILANYESEISQIDQLTNDKQDVQRLNDDLDKLESRLTTLDGSLQSFSKEQALQWSNYKQSVARLVKKSS